jgi:hypothetical protein
MKIVMSICAQTAERRRSRGMIGSILFPVKARRTTWRQKLKRCSAMGVMKMIHFSLSTKSLPAFIDSKKDSQTQELSHNLVLIAFNLVVRGTLEPNSIQHLPTYGAQFHFTLYPRDKNKPWNMVGNAECIFWYGDSHLYAECLNKIHGFGEKCSTCVFHFPPQIFSISRKATSKVWLLSKLLGSSKGQKEENLRASAVSEACFEFFPGHKLTTEVNFVLHNETRCSP